MNVYHSVFYCISLLFIMVEIYQLVNRDKIFSKLKISDIEKPVPYIIFYIFKLTYLIWIPIGLFLSSNLELRACFLMLILLGILKYIVVLTKKNIIINLYDLINTILSIFFLMVIFHLGFFQ